MKKILFLLVAALLISATSASAKSVKLGNETNSIFGKSFEDKPMGETDCIDDENCTNVKKCSSDTDCAANQYCSSANVCAKLCVGNKLKTGEICEGKTPKCYSDNHKSFCGCIEGSCDNAYECNAASHKCTPCSVGDVCGCSGNKKSNGSGSCVTCNFDTDCSDNQYCADARKESSLCKPLSCSSTQYVGNHKCNECSSALSGCIKCSSSTSCTECEVGKELSGGRCSTIDCGAGKYLSGNSCIACDPNCLTCTGAGACTVCATGFVNNAGVCEQMTCPDKFYLVGEECKPCSTNCTTCTEDTICTVCDAGYEPDALGVCIPSIVCSEGYSATVTSCPAVGGWVLSKDGAGCGMCMPAECPFGYSTGDKTCSSPLRKVSSGQSGGLSCTACACYGGTVCDRENEFCSGIAKMCCPNGSVPSAGSCDTPTPEPTCPSGYMTGINSCSAGQYLVTNGTENGQVCGKCMPCSVNCKTCATTSSNCTSCEDGYKLSGTSCVRKTCSELGFNGPSNSCPAGQESVAAGVSGSEGSCTKCQNIVGYCSSDTQCADNEKCSANKCQKVCTVDPCPSETPRCLASRHTRLCSCTSSSCPSNKVCKNGVCEANTMMCGVCAGCPADTHYCNGDYCCKNGVTLNAQGTNCLLCTGAVDNPIGGGSGRDSCRNESEKRIYDCIGQCRCYPGTWWDGTGCSNGETYYACR